MDVNNVNNTAGASQYNQQVHNNHHNSNTQNTQTTTPEETNTNPNQNEAAIYEPEATAKTYTPDMNKIQTMWADHEQKVASFRHLIETLISKQSEKWNIAINNANKDTQAFLDNLIDNPESLDIWGGEMVQVTDEMRAEAQKEIDEGGYYSVDETAKRILNFAVALSGGDPDKAGFLMDATIQGFKAAEKVWGGELPEISQKTYDAVMNGFEEWKTAGNASAITLLSK